MLSDEASGQLGRLCGRAARAENFEGHARSGDLRAYQYLGERYEWIETGKAGVEGSVNGNGNGVNGH